MPRRPLSSLSVVAALVCGAEAAAFVASSGRSSVGISSSPPRNSAINNPSFVTNAPRSPPPPPPSRQGSTTAVNAFLSFIMPDSGAGKSGSGRKQSDLQRLQEAAKSPETFEQFALNMKSGDGTDDDSISGNDDKSEDAPKTKKKGGYRPIEEWDEDLKNSKDGSGMTWEEKVMFEGQRHGNQVRQNDILMRNLHTW